jgi:hypothetical protein
VTTERINYVNVATGMCFVGFGILFLLATNGRMELQEIVKLWPVALILIGGAVILQARRGDANVNLAPIGGLIWILLLGLLFSHAFERRAKAGEHDGRVQLFAVMGGDKGPVLTGDFTGADITTVMGGAELDLRQASIAPGGTVVVDLFTAMGGCVIRAPADWQVDIQTTSIMAGVNDQRKRRPADDAEPAAARPPTETGGASATIPPAAPHLVLRGTVIMGGVTVKS